MIQYLLSYLNRVQAHRFTRPGLQQLLLFILQHFLLHAPLTCNTLPAAYDMFPCQTQLWYREKGNRMWYDPVFKVITLDGREVWRRRHYRVKRAEQVGTFYFTVLDSGVTSKCVL